MKFSDTAKALMLDALDESISTGMKFGSLHTAYSATGTNEVTGGSPAYARKALTWSAASSGSKALAATLPTWDVPAATTVGWIGVWDAVTVGTFLGILPNGGGALKRFAVPSGDLAGDTLESPAHGFSNGDNVVVWAATGIASGLTVGTVYFVVSSATNTLSLSLTSGGAAVDVTAVGSGFLQKIVQEVFGAQGTLAVSSLSVDLTAVA
jgi:hypothetical protein